MKKMFFPCALIVLAVTTFYLSASNSSDSLFDKKGHPVKNVRTLFKHLGVSIGNLEQANEFAQKNLLRNGERWQAQEKKEWHVHAHNKKSVLLSDLNALGMIETLEPKEKAYTYALVMGGLKERVDLRLNYLAELKQKGFTFKIIVLLGGERPLQALEKEDLPQEVATETDMMKHVFEHHPLLKKDTFMVINAPMVKKDNGTIIRPTTDSTLVLFALEAPLDGSCLVVSNSPFTIRQTKVAQRILDQKRFPTVGAGKGIEDKNNADFVMIMDELARTIYEEYKASTNNQ